MKTFRDDLPVFALSSPLKLRELPVYTVINRIFISFRRSRLVPSLHLFVTLR